VDPEGFADARDGVALFPHRSYPSYLSLIELGPRVPRAEEHRPVAPTALAVGPPVLPSEVHESVVAPHAIEMASLRALLRWAYKGEEHETMDHPRLRPPLRGRQAHLPVPVAVSRLLEEHRLAAALVALPTGSPGAHLPLRGDFIEGVPWDLSPLHLDLAVATC